VHTKVVYTCDVRNVTLSAEARVLERARELARKRSTTLNRMFREWLADLTSDRLRRDRYEELMRRLDGARSGGPFTRDQMNAR